ncbi:hypothetical protein AZE42_09234, partial [Rhizopogon vesiculosus]
YRNFASRNASFLAKEARITGQCRYVYLRCTIASIGRCVCERFEPACTPWSGKQILPGNHVRRPPKGHVYRGGYKEKRYVHIKCKSPFAHEITKPIVSCL